MACDREIRVPRAHIELVDHQCAGARIHIQRDVQILLRQGMSQQIAEHGEACRIELPIKVAVGKLLAFQLQKARARDQRLR